MKYLFYVRNLWLAFSTLKYYCPYVPVETTRRKTSPSSKRTRITIIWIYVYQLMEDEESSSGSATAYVELYSSSLYSYTSA